MKKILAIETSCDETSIAVLTTDYTVLSHVINTQIKHFEDLGGVVPEMASRLHEENLFVVYEQALKQASVTIDEIDVIAVTTGPGLIGSLLCGVNFAKTLAKIHNLKLIAVNHMQAHIHALNLEYEVSYPLLTLVVSGGHTMLVVSNHKDHFEVVGQTLDDAVGECFDKVARILGLGYPGGPKIQSIASSNVTSYQLPMPKNDNTLDFSFSGLKSACMNLTNQYKMKQIEIDKADFAASFQDVATEILVKKLVMAAKQYQIFNVAIVGGVSANLVLQQKVKAVFSDCLVPSLIYSTDNAAMIGARAISMLEHEKELNLVNANPNLKVDDNG